MDEVSKMIVQGLLRAELAIVADGADKILYVSCCTLMGSKLVGTLEFLGVLTAIAVSHLLLMIAAVLLSWESLIAGRTDGMLVLNIKIQVFGGFELHFVAQVAGILRSSGRSLVLLILHRLCCLVPSQSRVFGDAGRGMTRSTVTLMVLHVLLGLEHTGTAAHKAVALIDCMLIQNVKADEGCTAKACFAVHVETLLSVSHLATEDRNSISSYSSSSESSKGFSDRVELATVKRVRPVP